MSVWSHGYVFYALGYGTLLLCWFCPSNCSSFGCWELCQLAPVSLWHTLSLCFLFCFFEHLLTFRLQDAPGSSSIFLFPVLGSAFSSRDSGSFLLLENGLRNPDLGDRCVHCCWGLVSLCPLSRQSTEIYVRANLAYTHMLQIFLCVTTCLYIKRTWVLTDVSNQHLLSTDHSPLGRL